MAPMHVSDLGKKISILMIPGQCKYQSELDNAIQFSRDNDIPKMFIFKQKKIKQKKYTANEAKRSTIIVLKHNFYTSGYFLSSNNELAVRRKTALAASVAMATCGYDISMRER